MKEWTAKIQIDAKNMVEYKVNGETIREAWGKAVAKCRKDHGIAILVDIR